MTITIQLTEIPQNESVENRIFTLSKTGGDFGTAFDCLIHLPDRSGLVADIHGRFISSKQGMTISAINGNKIVINGQALASGRSIIIEDGTMIEVANYTMLISQLDNEEVLELENTITQSSNENSHFSLGDLQTENNDDFVMLHNKQKSNNAMNKNDNNHSDQQPHFTAKGVFSDDPFDEDPFKDEELAIKPNDEAQREQSKSAVSLDDVQNIETFTTEHNLDESVLDSDVIVFSSSKTKFHQENDQGFNDTKVTQLMTLIDDKINTANEQQANLFAAIDKTLSTFIEEFSPKHLEDVYSDFGTPLFVQKETQYWRSYRKSFNRRLDKGEYHRLFKALLLENMQKEKMKNKDDNG